MALSAGLAGRLDAPSDSGEVLGDADAGIDGAPLTVVEEIVHERFPGGGLIGIAAVEHGDNGVEGTGGEPAFGVLVVAGEAVGVGWPDGRGEACSLPRLPHPRGAREASCVDI